MQKKSNIYLKPQDFKHEYYLSVEKKEPTGKLLLMFEKIATKYSTKYPFNNKLDTDACINYALTEAWKKWDKYDETRSSNIFAFFTEMIKNDLAQHYNKLNHKKKLHVSIDAIFVNNQHK